MAGNLGFDTWLVEDACFTFGRIDWRGTARTADEVHAMSLANLDGEYCTVTDTATVSPLTAWLTFLVAPFTVIVTVVPFSPVRLLVTMVVALAVVALDNDAARAPARAAAANVSATIMPRPNSRIASTTENKSGATTANSTAAAPQRHPIRGRRGAHCVYSNFLTRPTIDCLL